MSEELIVTLGVQDKGASTQIRAFTKEIKALDTQYKATVNGSKTFANSFEGLKLKASTLASTLTAQKAKLSALRTQYAQCTTEIKKQEQNLESLKQQNKENTTEWNKTQETLSKYKAKAHDTQNQIKLLEQQIRNTTDALNETNQAINSFNLAKLGQQFQNAGKHITNFSEGLITVGQGMTSSGYAIAAFGTSIASIGVAAIKAYSDYESAFTGVRKTVDATEEQFKKLSNSFREMSLVMPESASSIAEVAEIAGQLGIKVESIEKFTEVMIKMGDSTNLSATEAAEAFAKFMNVMGNTDSTTAQYQDKVERLASAVVNLGNNTATTEADIMRMAQRLGSAGHQVGLNEAQVAALSATLSSLGLEAEAGGSAFSKLMVKMKVACETGGESLDAFAQAAGVSAEEFKQAFENDAYGAIDLFIKSLASGGEAGESAIKMLSDLGIEEVRLRDSILRVTNASDLMNKNLAIANEGWNENSALTTEAEKRYGTLASRLEMLKNKLTDAGIKLGEALVPALEDLMEKVSGLIDWFASLDQETQVSIVKFGAMAAVGGTLLVVLGKLVTTVGTLGKGFGTIVTGAGKLLSKLAGISSTASTAGSALSTVSASATTTATGMASSATASATAASSFTVLKTALAAIAPTALAVTAAVATLAAGIYTYHEYNDLMNQDITVSKEEMSLMERGLAKLTGTLSYSKDELQEMGLVYKDFNNNISEEFRSKVEEMTQDIHDFGMTIGEMNIDGVFTESEANAIISRVDNALKSCVTAIEDRSAQIQQGLTEAFNTDGVIDESEKSLIEYWSSRGSKEKEEAQKLQDEINEIINTARAEGRTLTSEERQAIEDYYAQIKQIELEAQASNSYEILYAQQEFQNRMSTLDAEGSKKLLKQRYDQYQEQNVQTKTNYDTLIAMAKEGYDGLSAQERAYVDETVKRLEEARDQELAVNKQKYDEDVRYAEEHCENLNLVWNKYRGEVVAKRDAQYYQEYEQMREHYAGLEQVTESGYKKMYNTATQTWDDLYVSVDATTGELKGVYDMNTGNLVTMTKNDNSALNDERIAWLDTSAGVLANCITMGTAYADFSGNVRNESGQVIGHIKKVEDENGNLVETIFDINGNPIDIGDNSDEVIRNLKNTGNAVDKVNGRKANITVTDNGTADQTQWKINNIHGKTVTVTVNQVPGSVVQHTKGGSWTINEQGTHGQVGQEQLAYINEKTRKSRGWELVDGPAAFLGSDSFGDKVLLGRGAAVTNNLTSTAMMMKAVQKEVASSINKLDFSSYATPNSRRSGALQATTVVQSPNIDIMGLRADVSSLTNTIAGLLIAINNSIQNQDNGIYIDSRKLVQMIAPQMGIELERNKRRR